MTHWVRFAIGNNEGFGTLDGAIVRAHDGDMFGTNQPTGVTHDLATVRLLAPVRPRKFVGLWNNFHTVAAAQSLEIPTFPLFFLKATSAIIGPDEPFHAPANYTGRVVYEGELGVVIGQRCTCVDETAAEAAIFGYTCVNDITAVGLFGDNPKFEQWARAKSPDGFGPVGPAIATGLDWRTLGVRTLLNGRERQNYRISDMILPPPRIISLLSQEMTLEPGDLITCGTSLGILPMKPGMYADLKIDHEMGKGLLVPESAVMRTGERDLAFRVLGQGRFEPVEVKLGSRFGERYEVLGGLVAGDEVVTSAAFLIDAESRLKAATSAFGGGHQHGSNGDKKKTPEVPAKTKEHKH